MKKEKKSLSVPVPKDGTPIIRLRHNRFDGFDVYTVETNGHKTLFHKEVLPKPFIVGGTFKVLGANGNLWLCENIETKQIHIGPNQSFENIIAEQKLVSTSTTAYNDSTSSASPQEMDRFA